MGADELLEYLNHSPADVGFLAVALRSGDPVIVPVWYRYDGTSVNVWTTSSRAWARRVTRTARAAFSVADDKAPFAGVTIRGRADLVEGDNAEILREVKAITARYVAAGSVDAYVAHWWPDLKAIVRVWPETIHAWHSAG